MKNSFCLEDIIGIEYSKLGFFREAQNRIAQLKTLTEELLRKQGKIQAIIDSISDLMFVIDLDFKILSVNKAYFKIFDYPLPIGRRCYEILYEKNNACNDCLAIKSLKTGNVYKNEKTILTEKGYKCFIESTSPIFDGLGNPYGILVLKRDITSEREYQRKLYEAEKFATLGLFASGVAHEINNPLTAIYGFSQGLKRKMNLFRKQLSQDMIEELETTLNTIIQESNRCIEIIRRLFIYTNNGQERFLNINLNWVVKNALRFISYNKKVNLKEKVSVELDQNLKDINGNPYNLIQLVINLVSNAIDATEKKGKIFIRTYLSKKDTVVLEVEDTGCGIAKEHLPKIFDPFFTTKPVGKGMGMGLSICYNIAIAHRAKINVFSEKNKGTKFIVEFNTQ